MTAPMPLAIGTSGRLAKLAMLAVVRGRGRRGRGRRGRAGRRLGGGGGGVAISDHNQRPPLATVFSHSAVVWLTHCENDVVASVDVLDLFLRLRLRLRLRRLRRRPPVQRDSSAGPAVFLGGD